MCPVLYKSTVHLTRCIVCCRQVALAQKAKGVVAQKGVPQGSSKRATGQAVKQRGGLRIQNKAMKKRQQGSRCVQVDNEAVTGHGRCATVWCIIQTWHALRCTDPNVALVSVALAELDKQSSQWQALQGPCSPSAASAALATETLCTHATATLTPSCLLACAQCMCIYRCYGAAMFLPAVLW